MQEKGKVSQSRNRLKVPHGRIDRVLEVGWDGKVQEVCHSEIGQTFSLQERGNLRTLRKRKGREGKEKHPGVCRKRGIYPEKGHAYIRSPKVRGSEEGKRQSAGPSAVRGEKVLVQGCGISCGGIKRYKNSFTK